MSKTKKAEEKLQLPDELKLETYPRIIQSATFDILELVLKFMPGYNGIGAIVESFKYAIGDHDNIVKRIEEQMALIITLKREYQRKNRLFRNLDSAWNVMLDAHKPSDFYEYQELLPKMKNMEERILIVQDTKIKAQLITQYNRFHQLHPVCSNQLIIYNTFVAARKEKDEAMATLMNAERELNARKEEEKTIASGISDDHIMADKTGKSLQALFPNVRGIN